MQRDARTADADHGMAGQNIGIPEKINVRLLPASNAGFGFIQDELLTRERTGYHIQPSILKCAFHQAHADAGGQAEQAKANGPAYRTDVSGHRDRIENHATKSSSDGSAQHPVCSLLRGLTNDSVNHATDRSKNHPGEPTTNPHRRISVVLRSSFVDDSHKYRKERIRHHVENKTQQNSQRQSERAAQQGLAHRAFHDALGDSEPDAHQGDDQRNNEEVSPPRSRTVDKTRLGDSPARERAQHSRHAKIEPALQEDAAPFCWYRHKLFRRLVNGSVHFGSQSWRNRGDDGLRNRHTGKILGRDLDRIALTW